MKRARAIVLAPTDTSAGPKAAAVLAKALVRAANAAGLSQRALARMLGVSEATASRIARGRGLDPDSKEGELALAFLRLYRSLDALLGGNQAQVRAWMAAPNQHLGGRPAELVQTAVGLFHAAEYLDALRGRG